VQEALDDPRPAISHSRVEAYFAKRRAAASRKARK
jgi:DNA-damage-inducible protein J